MRGEELEVNLYDYITGSCPYESCIYNNIGYCEYDEESFKKDRVEEAREIFNTEGMDSKEYFFTCSVNIIKEGYCSCGGKLIPHKQISEWCGIKVTETLWECENGC